MSLLAPRGPRRLTSTATAPPSRYDILHPASIAPQIWLGSVSIAAANRSAPSSSSRQEKIGPEAKEGEFAARGGEVRADHLGAPRQEQHAVLQISASYVMMQ